VGNSGLKAFKVDLGCMTYNIERSSVVIMPKIYHRVDEGRGPVDPVGHQTNDGAFVNQVDGSLGHH